MPTDFAPKFGQHLYRVKVQDGPPLHPNGKADHFFGKMTLNHHHSTTYRPNPTVTAAFAAR
ncbi:hypothetical protein [Pseudorhodobacter antarcticus]|jgi:hypothetical protein|uniref:hypothetical protein n=1 Tax=Pseudorhodobacter antarcticus TaxID=1077947 RepID=UPI000AD5C63D|nr:hypothetical protein [Pseudorhodobacter antarcticus]